MLVGEMVYACLYRASEGMVDISPLRINPTVRLVILELYVMDSCYVCEFYFFTQWL